MSEEFEEHFLQNRKAGRKSRKAATTKDRSKYKKSDFDKYVVKQTKESQAKAAKKELFRGRVLSIFSEGILVYYNKKEILCSLRGLFKKEITRAKNLIVVGDFVLFEKSSSAHGTIAHILPRMSVLSRKSSFNNREQLIAANIDQVLIVATLKEPLLDGSMIDRALIASQKGGMKPLLLLNKMDLVEKNSVEFREFLKAYESLGFTLLLVSCLSGEGIMELKEKMQQKSSVFAGPSGVGKSSLINEICQLDLEVQEVAEKTERGRHTTTRAQLIRLPTGGWCIDTPGIQNFGLWEPDVQTIREHYSEFEPFAKACRYSGCTHTHEPECGVKAALAHGTLSTLRYHSYLKLIQKEK